MKRSNKRKFMKYKRGYIEYDHYDRSMRYYYTIYTRRSMYSPHYQDLPRPKNPKDKRTIKDSIADLMTMGDGYIHILNTYKIGVYNYEQT